VELRVLGPLEAFADGQPVRVGTPKQRALLVMLAVNAGRVVSVDRLVDELWADEPPARAIASLQAYISRLRRALEPARSSDDRSALLVSRPPGYLLAVAPESVDLHRFAAEVSAGRSLLGTDPAAALARLVEGLRLWRGEPLPDLGAGRFAQAERARLDELRLAAVEDRFAAMLALGRPAEVAAEAEAVLAESPYRERVWGQLMMALHASSRQADALAAYRRARERLDEDLGIEPGPALRQLESDILRQARHLHSVPAVVTVARPVEPDPPDAAGAVVGRADVLRQLDDAIAGLAFGRSCVLLVSGGAGIGKSTMLRELSRRAAAAGAVVAAGAGIDGHPPPAFWPWAQVLRAMVDTVDPQALADAFAPYGNVPAILDPALATVVPLPQAEPPGDPELARTRIYQAVVEGLQRFAAERPLLVIIDDAHWLDPASALLLKMLAATAARIVVAVAYRDTDLAADAPFVTAREVLGHLPTCVAVELTGLARGVCAVLASRVASHELTDSVVDVLYERTAGNPFFLTELTRVLVSEHAVDQVDRVSEVVPARVQEALRRRLARLPEQLNAVLSVAAVLGRTFAIDLLRKIVQLDDQTLFDSLDTAVVVGILENADDPRLLRFSHDLLRQTLYLDQGALRRAQLHARVAEALREHPATPSTELAHHLRQALPVVSPQQVVPLLVDAAAEAYDRTAYEQADALLTESLQLLGDEPAGEVRDHLELLVRTSLGFMYQVVEGYVGPHAAEHFGRMGEILARVRLEIGDLPALWGWLSFENAVGRAEQSVATARRLLARESSDWAAAVIYAHDGLSAWNDGELLRAREIFEAGARVIPAAGFPALPIIDWPTAVGIHAPLASITAMLGEHDAARRHLDAAWGEAQPGRRDFLFLYLSFYEIRLAFQRRDAGLVRDHARAVLTMAEHLGFPEYQARAAASLGWAEAVLGDVGGVARVADAIAGGCELTQLAEFALWHGEALLATGAPQTALPIVDEGLRRPLDVRARYARPDLHCARARALTALGRPDEAAAAVGAALGEAQAMGFRAAELRALAAAQTAAL
jgi:DNA-binding SARP family transcriptional activator